MCKDTLRTTDTQCPYVMFWQCALIMILVYIILVLLLKKKKHKITAFDLHSFEQLFEPLSARHTHTHAHHLNTVQSQSPFGKLNVRSFIKLKAVKSQINQ